MSFDFLTAIKNIAPMIAGTFGTPLAGIAVKTLCDFIPDEHKATVQQAQTSGGADAALQKIGDLFQQGQINAVQIKQAEAAHVERMAELGYKTTTDLQRLAVDDRVSARAREVAVRDRTPAHLAYLIIFGFFFYSGLLLYAFIWMPETMAKIPAQGWVIIGTVYGYLATEAKQASAYFFGDTSASQAKTATISAIAKNGGS